MKIRHEPREERFVADAEGNRAGLLEYERLGETTLDYRHTFVLEEYRGRGIATALVRHALDHALEQELQVVPSCPFVATVMEREPRYRELRAERATGRQEQEDTRRLHYAMQAVGS